MIYIIDHQDSFTWNVVHQFSTFDKVYCTNYFDIDKKKLDQSDVIVLSPGPGSPKDYPITSKIYKKYKGKKKIIGICLGYQLILFNEKGKIVQQKNIFHGYQSKVKVTKDVLASCGTYANESLAKDLERDVKFLEAVLERVIAQQKLIDLRSQRICLN